MGVYLPNSRLPSAYQEVEYIYSSWQQILNSWFTTSSNYLQIEWKIRYLNNVGSYNYFYGGSPNWLTMERVSGNARWNTASSTGLLSTTMTQWVDYVYNIKYNNGTQTVNGSSTSYSGSIASKWPIYFFAWGSTLSNSPSAIRCYYLKIYSWSGFTLVRDFVPCYRKSDSVAGMYDLVNNQFYTSTTSTNFTAWSDVYEAPIQNAYIWQYTN